MEMFDQPFSDIVEVDLSEHEINERASELASYLSDVEAKEGEKKSFDSQARAEIKGLKRKISKLKNEIGEKKAEVSVEVVWKKDLESGKAQKLIVETNELLTERSLSPDELQSDLIFDQKETELDSEKG